MMNGTFGIDYSAALRLVSMILAPGALPLAKLPSHLQVLSQLCRRFSK